MTVSSYIATHVLGGALCAAAALPGLSLWLCVCKKKAGVTTGLRGWLAAARGAKEKLARSNR